MRTTCYDDYFKRSRLYQFKQQARFEIVYQADPQFSKQYSSRICRINFLFHQFDPCRYFNIMPNNLRELTIVNGLLLDFRRSVIHDIIMNVRGKKKIQYLALKVKEWNAKP